MHGCCPSLPAGPQHSKFIQFWCAVVASGIKEERQEHGPVSGAQNELQEGHRSCFAVFCAFDCRVWAKQASTPQEEYSPAPEEGLATPPSEGPSRPRCAEISLIAPTASLSCPRCFVLGRRGAGFGLSAKPGKPAAPHSTAISAIAPVIQCRCHWVVPTSYQLCKHGLVTRARMPTCTRRRHLPEQHQARNMPHQALHN